MSRALIDSPTKKAPRETKPVSLSNRTLAYLLNDQTPVKDSWSAIRVAGVIEKGLPKNSLNRLREDFHLNNEYLAQTLGLSSRTVSRRDHLGGSESDRLYRLTRLFIRAIEVLGSNEKALEWLQSVRPALGGKKPLELANTDVGSQEVEMLLGRIEHGVFS